MKLTKRAGLAAMMTCMATAAAVTPAVAGSSVPVTVPLEGLDTALPFEAPSVSTGVPIPMPGSPGGPRHVVGSLTPSPLLPKLPVTTELPPTLLNAPLTDPLTDDKLGSAAVTTPSSPLRAESPGAILEAPLTPPQAELFGLPELSEPQAGLLAPTLRGAPTANLGLL
ncbi:hypothetical protein A8W25_30785 [Streptomyces sp. ERV7]|uniref:hypothetical protein n=1 Tax=Streptomyces sp. ERV7 TaxID=1322334 RepID=UPI0007F4620C|nr:hypothetical protein [Streptomyces sp. ERV7]OAR21884.1 hypothetical protein A8W25_30785 [Streptomyces sp. ERV7]